MDKNLYSCCVCKDLYYSSDCQYSCDGCGNTFCKNKCLRNGAIRPGGPYDGEKYCTECCNDEDIVDWIDQENGFDRNAAAKVIALAMKDITDKIKSLKAEHKRLDMMYVILHEKNL